MLLLSRILRPLAKLVDSLGSGQSWLELAERIQVEHRMVLEGVFYWDLDAGRAASLDLRGRTEVDLAIDLDLEGYGFAGWGWQLLTELSGELELEAQGVVVKAE